MQCRVGVCTLDCELEVAGYMENLTTLQNRRNLVHFLDDFVSGALRDSGQRRVSSGAVSSLLVLGESLALKVLEPSGAVLLVLVKSVRSACGYGVRNFNGGNSAGVDTVNSSFSFFEFLKLGVKVAQLLFDCVKIDLAAALKH